jgi:hypothetical protein
MQTSRAGAVLAALSLASISCAPPAPARAPLNELAARASFDLDCASPWLRLTDIGERVKGVDGCGKRATYVELCQLGDATCAWWNNTVAGSSSFGPPPGAAARAPEAPPTAPTQEVVPNGPFGPAPARWR